MKGDVEEGPGIRATRDAIAEVRAGRAVVTIPRADIASVALRRGIGAERPIIEGLVGLAMLVAGAAFGRATLAMIASGPVTRGTATFAAGAAFLVGMGLVLLARVVRVCDLVELTSQRGERRKLAFSARLTPEDRRRFAARLRDLGWSVTAVSGD